MGCRITKRTEWVTRMYLEYLSKEKKGAFVTLTYAPEFLPSSHIYDGGTLIKEHFQLFMKRFRKNYNQKYGTTQVRFFAVGEYGDKSHRAHYHFCVFGLDTDKVEAITAKSWGKGFHTIGQLNEERMIYTAQYTTKKMTAQKEFPDGRQPEFTLQSKNPAIGYDALPLIAKKLSKHNLYPKSALSTFQRWLLFDAGYEMKPFNGWFKIGKRNAKLDRTMMTKLADLVDPRVKNLAQTLDDNEILLPEQFKKYRDFEEWVNKYCIITFNLGGEKDEVLKKQEKEARKQIRKLQETGTRI